MDQRNKPVFRWQKKHLFEGCYDVYKNEALVLEDVILSHEINLTWMHFVRKWYVDGDGPYDSKGKAQKALEESL